LARGLLVFKRAVCTFGLVYSDDNAFFIFHLLILPAVIFFLQKTIKVTVNVPKTGRYHVVFDYVLDQKDAVQGQVELSPQNQGSKQSSSVTFPSTRVGSTFTNGYAVAGENGISTQFMLTKGTWDLTFTTTPSKLLLV